MDVKCKLTILAFKKLTHRVLKEAVKDLLYIDCDLRGVEGKDNHVLKAHRAEALEWVYSEDAMYYCAVLQLDHNRFLRFCAELLRAWLDHHSVKPSEEQKNLIALGRKRASLEDCYIILRKEID